MAEDGIKPRVVLAALIGGATGLLLATPGGRRWLQRATASARSWLEYGAEDLGQLLEARVERSAALRRAPAQTTGAAARQIDERLMIARVREALARDGRVHARRVKVMMIGGVVHLEGVVATPEEREIAGEVAQQAARTHILVNDLHVG
ncbi:MAG: BON domain-containing protein [Armatimonadetes bacterium]|jgi:osmotically-inducible protein OsmY|nr:BON domain-containing protein [Armatimonadota bacterium]